jgi:hypothetical protein
LPHPKSLSTGWRGTFYVSVGFSPRINMSYKEPQKPSQI